MKKYPPAWQVASRWIFFLPGAFAAAMVTSIFVRLIMRGVLFLNGMNPDGILNKLWLEVVGSALMGAAFVYAGIRISPSHWKTVGYILSLFVILLSGFISFPAILLQDWWAIVGCVAMAAGGAYVAYSIATGELNLANR